MKVVFLDFDGVVVCLPLDRDKLTTGKLVRAASRECVARLNEIIRRTGAVVVVSSTWRKHHTLEMLRATLERAGFVGEVIGTTAVLYEDLPGGGCKSVERGLEICDWLMPDAATPPLVESYVVLDDDYDRGPVPVDRWVHVKNGWGAGGLQDVHVERAVRVLGEI